MSRWIIIVFTFFMTVSGYAQDEKYNQKDDQGRKHGLWVKTWPKNTIKKYEGRFEHGTPVGLFKFWYETGELKSKIWYLEDSVVRAKMYHPSGYLMAKGKYVGEQKKDSTWLYYDERGRISFKENYKDGKLHGKRIVFYVDPNIVQGGKLKFEPGQIYMIEHYKNGVQHGPWVEYFYDGKVKVEGEFVDGNLDGKVTYYYPNGKKEKVLHFKYAVKHGFQYFFDESGKERHRRFYLEGRELKGKELEKYLEKAREKSTE